MLVVPVTKLFLVYDAGLLVLVHIVFLTNVSVFLTNIFGTCSRFITFGSTCSLYNYVLLVHVADLSLLVVYVHVANVSLFFVHATDLCFGSACSTLLPLFSKTCIHMLMLVSLF